MKIAVASDKNYVAQHFGHCKEFSIFTTANNKIISHKVIPNPGHKPGFLPNYLNDLGINTIISGGMGGGAVSIFNDKEIEVVIGTKGLAKDAVSLYLKGQLTSTGSICHEHEHEDECNS